MANFGISEKIEKIETSISENLKIFGYDLNFLIWTPLTRGEDQESKICLNTLLKLTNQIEALASQILEPVSRVKTNL